jgi:pimeloyl-ACP methyl ester carboxylesterase
MMNRNRLGGAALVAAVLLAGGCYADRINRRTLHPSGLFELIPEDLDLTYEAFAIPVDGAVLHAWFIPAENARRPETIVVAGGNSNNKQLLLPLARELTRAGGDDGYNVVLFDYRGFGLSTGEPDLWSLVPDARHVVKAVRARPDTEKVGLLGVSLGSVVALGVATGDPDAADAVVVEGVFSPSERLGDLIGGFLAAIGGFFIMPADFDVEANVVELEKPLFFVHGTEDGITPLRPAARIFRTAEEASAPRDFWVVEGAGHAPGVAGHTGLEYVAQIRGFFDTHLRDRPDRLHLRPRWERITEGSTDAHLSITLESAGSKQSADRVPVEVFVIFEEADPLFKRVWHTPSITHIHGAPAPEPPIFVGARVPAIPVRDEPGVWDRNADEFQRDRAEWDAFEEELHAKLGYGRVVFRFGGKKIIFTSSRDRPDPEKRLADCREIQRRLEAIFSHEIHPWIRPRYAEAYEALGRNLKLAGRNREALAAYERYLELLPDRPFAQWRFYDAAWDIGVPVHAVVQVLETMQTLTDHATLKARYRALADDWKRRAKLRTEAIEAWMAEQRKVLEPK